MHFRLGFPQHLKPYVYALKFHCYFLLWSSGSPAEEEDEIDPLDAFMMGNNAAGAVQQQQSMKPDPDSKAGVLNRPPLAGGPAMNGKVKRAPARRGKRSMYDTDSSSDEDDEDEEDKEQSDDEDDEVRLSKHQVITMLG